jgi:hypothetical protein
MKWQVIYRIALAGLMLGMIPTLSAAKPSTVEEIAAAIDWSGEEQRKVLAGYVVASDLPETTESILAQAVAVILPEPPSDLRSFGIDGQSYNVDPDILGFGKIDLDNIEESLTAAKFTESDADEVDELRSAEPGSGFNLSTEEFSTIQKAVSAGAKSPAQITNVYQKILAARVKAYASGGISAIAPYDRDGAQVSPSTDLKAAIISNTFLQKLNPDLYKAFLSYPNDQIDGIEETFQWVKQRIQKRPTFILEHRMVHQRQDVFLALIRHFYVSQAYDSAQATIGMFPMETGTLVLFTTRTMTDQVTGFMQGIRHRVGRDMMRDELVTHFEALQMTQ